MGSRVVAFTLVLSAASCARANDTNPPRPADAEIPVTINGLRLQLPAQTGGFMQIDNEFIDLNQGYRTRYRDSVGVQADIFVYPLPWPDAMCPASCASEVVKNEAAGFASDGPAEMIRLDYLDGMEVVADSALVVGDPGISIARHVTFNVTDDGKTGRSDYILVGYLGYRFKLRMTDYENRTGHDTAVDLFLDLLTSIDPPYVCAYGPGPESSGPTISTRLGADARQIQLAVDSTLRLRAWDLKFADGGLWTTRPQFEWPDGTEAETWHGDVHPGYQAVVQLQQAGDSIQLTVAAPTVCDIGEYAVIDGDTLTGTLQMIVAGSLASDVTDLLDSLATIRR